MINQMVFFVCLLYYSTLYLSEKVLQSNLSAGGGGDAGASDSKGDGWGGTLHKAGQILISCVVTQLHRGKRHLKGNFHPWVDKSF